MLFFGEVPNFVSLGEYPTSRAFWISGVHQVPCSVCCSGEWEQRCDLSGKFLAISSSTQLWQREWSACHDFCKAGRDGRDQKKVGYQFWRLQSNGCVLVFWVDDGFRMSNGVFTGLVDPMGREKSRQRT